MKQIKAASLQPFQNWSDRQGSWWLLSETALSLKTSQDIRFIYPVLVPM